MLPNDLLHLKMDDPAKYEDEVLIIREVSLYIVLGWFLLITALY
jgi:hypothetical protein